MTTRNFSDAVRMGTLMALWLTTALTARAEEKEIPFLFEKGHIIVQAMIDGKGPFKAAVDSGCDTIWIITSLAHEQRIVTQAPKTIDLLKVKVKFAIDGIAVDGIEASVGAPPPFAVIYRDRGIGVIVGHEFLKNFRYSIDYPAGKLTFERYAAEGRTPAKPIEGAIPFTMIRNHVVVDVKFNGKGPYKGMIDTGSPAVQLTQKVAGEIGQTVDVDVGGQTVKGIKAFTDREMSDRLEKFGVHALIGAQYLHRFRVTIDEKQGVISFQQSKGRQESFRAIAETEHYAFRSGTVDAGEIERYKELMEALYATFMAEFGNPFAIAPPKEKMIVILFKTNDQFLAHCRSVGINVISNGFYGVEQKAFLTYLEQDDPADRSSVPLHEGIHQLVHTLLYGGRSTMEISPWFSEGLANYYQSGTVSGKSVTVSELPPRRAMFMYAIKKKSAIPLRRLMAKDFAFAGQEAYLAYAEAWGVIHYLYHGEKGKYRTKIHDYLKSEIAGKGEVAELERILGIKIEEFERGLHKHILSMPWPKEAGPEPQ